MTAVLLIRHPRTTWNDEGRYQGRLDAPLTPEGERQAAAVRALFRGADFAAVYSSPLERASRLACSLAEETQAPLCTDERLAEIGLGEWQGLLRDQIAQRFPDTFRQWYVSPDLVRFPGGESLADVQTRTEAWLGDVLTRHRGSQTVVAVTHSAVIQVLAACSLGLELSCLHRINIANCSITILAGKEPPGSVVTLNDLQALYPSPADAVKGDFVSLMERRATH